MTKIFKLRSTRAPRSLVQYRRDALEEIIVGLSLPEEEIETPEMILEQAREEAALKVQEAYAEGMRRGFETGKSQFEESVGMAVEALQASIENMEEARRKFIESLSPQVLELSLAIARQVLQREAQTDPDLVLRLAKRALNYLANLEQVTLRVNPADLQALKSRRVEILEQVEGIAQLNVVADESVDPGGCIASCGFMEADAQVDTQFNLIAEELRRLDETPGE